MIAVKKLRERTSLDKAEMDMRPLRQISVIFSMSSWSTHTHISYTERAGGRGGKKSDRAQNGMDVLELMGCVGAIRTVERREKAVENDAVRCVCIGFPCADIGRAVKETGTKEVEV
jgi:hypothetical protein